MKKIIKTLFICTLLFSAQLSLSEEATNQTETATKDDQRTFVSIPEPVREFMRVEMRSHLATINEIIGYLGSNDLDSAAYIAESNLGRGAMAKNKDADIHPGMYMTPEMRNIGWRMHAAATEFAITAKKGDVQSAYSALQKVTSSCVSCHSSFRTR